jgi:F0F1-type ATP synthase gamma subunit
MSNSTASLRRQVSRAGDLQSVVRTMKSLAASSIGQYEKSALALADDARTVELGLSACFHEGDATVTTGKATRRPDAIAIGAVVFGSDQVSLFRACAESLASENASRLAAMDRADKNIDDRLETLHGTFHRLRQSRIDEELFDVVSGFEALVGPR